jgi:UDP-N-acetyl-D-mannosaminuronic acid dehydrogenase
MSKSAQPDTRIAIVGGCGHVGLPLGMSFASKGCEVTLVDINAASVAQVNRGEMPFLEHGAPELLRKVAGKTLRATTEAVAIRDAHVVVCIVGTPIDEHLNPQVDKLIALIKSLAVHLRPEQLFVLRSTVFPGATEHVARHLHALVPGIDVAFCPERVAQGHALREFEELPQLVAGLGPRARERAGALFRRQTDRIIEVEPIEADYYKVWEAITSGYPRMSGLPRAGLAAGPCLLKDTMQLAAFSDNEFSLGQASMLVNEGLPRVLLNQLRARGLRDKTVGILGMAFKADNDDTRDSLAFRLRKLLAVEAGNVLCTDELARGPWWSALDEVLERSDLLIIGAPHTRYKTLKPTRPTLDPWNCLGRGGLLQ